MDKHHHDNVIESIAKEYSDILENSEQGIYIYLDDTHKVCNKKFATLLGYESEDEWAKIDISFPEAFVANESQETLISGFQAAMEDKSASINNITWKRKDESTVDTKVILVPIIYNGHLLALHFVSEK